MKGYWKILLILMLAVGFASCEDDQGEIEYVITGPGMDRRCRDECP